LQQKLVKTDHPVQVADTDPLVNAMKTLGILHGCEVQDGIAEASEIP
jgi:hypothetical protein